jgi:DNA sulfur modification protein DndD
MILKKLILDNFRQYLGRQEIFLAHGKRKNVTIIHGENGFGKTCFLNSLLWGFYGKGGLTDDLPYPEKIIPDTIRIRTTTPNDEVASVQIDFSHNDLDYTLVRSITLAQELAALGEETEFELSVLQPDGQTKYYHRREAQKIIDSMLPPDLRELFFFNGERIDHLAMDENKLKIRDSVRGLLGLQLIEQSIGDLRSTNVRGKLMREIQENADEETAQLIEQEASKQVSLDRKKLALETCKENQQGVAKRLEAISANLEANRVARELQQRRTLLANDLLGRQNDLQDLEKQLGELISKESYSLFCSELIEKGESITHRLRAEGRIPARVMNDFIEDLLKAEECICGTCLPKDSEKWKRVSEQLTKAGDPEFNRAVGDLDKGIGAIKASIARTRESLGHLVGRRSELIDRITAIKEEQAEIQENLDAQEDQEVRQLENERERQESRQADLHREEGALQNEIQTITSDLQKLREQIAEREIQLEEGQKAQRRLQRLDETANLLEQILQLESDDLRRELGHEIERVFSLITVQDYRLRLTEEFSLKLTKSMMGPTGRVEVDVGHSTGHRQVMSLVFIASLVALAQRRNDIGSILRNLQGGDYPMIMDSPFGQLGGNFRSSIAHHVPALAPQCIVLVSSSQYEGEVEKELGASDRIGKRYLLIYKGPSKKDEAKDQVAINGIQYTVYHEDQNEHTHLEEI